MNDDTVRAGVSLAIPADQMPSDRTDVAKFSEELGAHLWDGLQRHTGGARPVTPPKFHVTDRPHDDPLQGLIYVASLSAEYRVDDLGADTTAYQSHMKESRR